MKDAPPVIERRWQDHLGPFCEHMADGGASDLSKDIARVAAHQVFLALNESMKRPKADAWAQSMRPEIHNAVFKLLTKGYIEEPSDCPHCDGYGRCWNNADPTSGQFVACTCERGTNDPPGV